MRAAIFLSAVLVVFSFGKAWSDSVPAFEAVPWLASNQGTLKKMLDGANVTKLVALLENTDDRDVAVGNLLLASLHGDNRLQLLVTADYSGRGFFSHLLIIEQGSDGKPFVSQSLDTGGVTLGDISDLLIDLNHDGRTEIVLPKLIGGYRGARPTPVVPDVYQWNGKAFEVADQTHRNYYELTVRPKLSEKLVDVESRIQLLNTNAVGHVGRQDEINDLLDEQQVIEKQIGIVDKLIKGE